MAELQISTSHNAGRGGGGTRVIEAVKMFLWVAPLTVLIWVYAEREQVTPMTVKVPFIVRPPGGDRVVSIVSPADRLIEIDLEGPRASVESIRDAISNNRMAPVELTVGDDVPAGQDSEIPVLDQVRHVEAFGRGAITINKARPAVKVHVETRVWRDVPVRLSPGEAPPGEITFKPETVRIEGPASAFKDLPADQLVVFADMSAFRGFKPGDYTQAVRIRFPFAPEVTHPREVIASVKLKQQETLQVAAIPLFVELSARSLEQDKFKIKCPLTLPNVTLSGPPDAIALVRESKFVPLAFIDLTPDDMTKAGEITRKLKAESYRVPKDVTVVNPERDVTITLSDRGG